METKVTVTGGKRIKKTLQKLVNERGPQAYRTSLLKFMLKVENSSFKKTPKDTGYLRGSLSGNTAITDSGPNGANGVVFYTADYAPFVHERTELRHDIGEAKFLSKAVNENVFAFQRDLKTALKRTIFIEGRLSKVYISGGRR